MIQKHVSFEWSELQTSGMSQRLVLNFKDMVLFTNMVTYINNYIADLHAPTHNPEINEVSKI